MHPVHARGGAAAVHARALSLYPRPNMNDKASMGYSMVTRVNGSQLRYTEWVNLSRVDGNRDDDQWFVPLWRQSLGVELYNHTASGTCWDCLENDNLAPGAPIELLQALSATLRAAWR